MDDEGVYNPNTNSIGNEIKNGKSSATVTVTVCVINW
jgi:hypothetical protein